MTYLAPRQGIFAIIVTISFILHTLLLVASHQQQLAQINQQTGERIVEQLISESTLALSSKDKVSLSVLAKRYTSEFDIASLTIKDGDNNVLVSIGNNPLSQGEQIMGVATLDEALLGEVTLSLAPINTGSIFASLWLFILGSLLIHFFIWLLYGYVSRPTKSQLAKLSQEVRGHLLKQQPQLARARRGESAPISQVDATDVVNKDNSDSLTIKPSMSEILKGNVNIGQAVNEYVHEHGDNTRQHQHDKTKADNSTPKATLSQKPLIATRNMDVVVVQIQFVDKDNLLSTLAPEKSEPYFALCTQLLEQTITDLQKLPSLHGIVFTNVAGFGTQLHGEGQRIATDHKNQSLSQATGAKVTVQAGNDYAKVGLAAVMLAKLYVMLNRIVYTKHRELQRFALTVKVGVSDEATSAPMQQLMAYHAGTDDILVLLPKAGITQLNGHIQLQSIKRPTTVYERESALVIGTNDAMMHRLVEVRNKVLLSGRKDLG